MIRPWYISFFLLFIHCLEAKPFIEASSRGQLGNQMFIVASIYAFAWDNNVDVYVPELTYKYDSTDPSMIQKNLEHIFSRCNISKPPSSAKFVWNQPNFAYHKIPFHPDMRIEGYFQSETYFAHQRNRVLELFAPLDEDWNYIKTKYKWLLDHPSTVSVHLRKYWDEPNGNIHIQYGKDYLRKAMQKFPKNARFIIFSNDHVFAKENIPEEVLDRVVHIENEHHYIELFLQSACKDNIITNSSFGWWGAWLNRNPKKIVVAPSQWTNSKAGIDTSDLIPKDWIQIEAKWGPLKVPSSYQ
ncbi:MAG: alpha-1,2-fucosyltransferase [Chlamydiae bacterium]|nr:alpha-1,2-fucosyltransferase [Chlamydiota bacterium]